MLFAFLRESRRLVQLNSFYGSEVSYISKCIDMARYRSFLCHQYFDVNVGVHHLKTILNLYFTMLNRYENDIIIETSSLTFRMDSF